MAGLSRRALELAVEQELGQQLGDCVPLLFR